MKTTTKYLLLLLAVIFSAQLWATTYTYSGSWSPGLPLGSVKKFNAGDAVIISSGATYSQTNNFEFKNGATLTINSGAEWITNKKDIIFKNNSTGTNNGTLTIENKGVLKLLQTSIFTNNGDITVQDGGDIDIQDNAKLINASAGNISIEQGGELKMKENSIFENNGALTVDGNVTLKNNADFSNTGTVVINSTGNFKLKGSSDVTNTGTFVVNGTLDVSTKNSLFDNQGTIIGVGTIKTKTKSGNLNLDNSNGSINGCSGSTCLNSGSNDLGASAPNVTSFIIWDGTNYLTLEGVVVVPDNTMGLVLQANLVLAANENLVVGILYTEDFLNPSGGTYPTYTCTISSTSSLTADSYIDNKSTITVESGGSLVQNSIDDNNIGVGNYIINQSGGQTNNMAYNIWSSPINNADLLSVFPSTNPCGMYVFNASTQEWKYDFSTASTYTCNGNSGVDFTGFTYSDGAADGLMDAGRGYFIPGDGTSNAKTYSGTVNNGTISLTVYSTNVDTTGTGWDGNDWNLIGNPYPSGVDPSLFWATNSGNLTDGLYFWDNDISDYIVWNALGGGTTPSGFEIAVSQGFYVLTDDVVIPNGTSGTISFENAMRTNTGGDFYKKENEKNAFVSVSVSTPNGEVNQIVVGYSKNTTNEFDKMYDAHKLSGNPNIRFASLWNNQEFIIQSVAPIRLGKSKVIALSVFTAETGDHTFSEYNRENIPNGMEVYLKDTKTNVLHDLTGGDYTVNLDGNQTYDSRFELIFVNNGVVNDDSAADVDEDDSSADVVTGVETIDISDFTLLNEANAYTLYNANGIKGDVQVISITGTVVWTKSGVNTTSLPIELNGLSSGIYFIQVINNDERVYTNKIVNP